ncbi:MAG TPA: NFACT RNA binding domain-containing protein, partial [Armatimonadota bacterium]
MAFDSIIIAAVAAELNSTLAGGRVDKIQQPSPLDVVLTIRNSGANYMLLVSADAQSPRVHLTSIKRPNPQTAPNFCMLMRKYLEGARLVEVDQIDFDRILHLKFAAYDGERFTLVLEIMGKHSNAILMNDAQRILGAIKPVGHQKNRYREILPGKDYVPPPSQNKINPMGVSLRTFLATTSHAFPGAKTLEQAEMASWLTKTFTGLSPFAARELAARSCGEINQLAEEFLEFFSSIRQHKFTPVLITDDAGLTVDYYAFPSLQYKAANQHERTSVNSLADVYYSSALPRKAFEQAREELIHRVRRELESRQKTLESIKASLTSSADAERFKQLGELILSQTSSIREGAESAELIDYYDPNGAAVTVQLDQQLSAPENAEAYFRKYHKALSGADALRDRITEIGNEIKILRPALESAESASSIEDVDDLSKSLASQGVVFRRQEAIEASKQKPEFEGYRISKVMSGKWEILVGQNSQSNDYLVQRVAKPNDLWVHVKASPSAHVVIRTNNKPDSVPRQVILEAAELAAQHSDQKHSSLVPVDYTLRKYVRKPKGSAPGKVIYVNEK